MHPLFAFHGRLLHKPGVDVARGELSVLHRRDRHRFTGQFRGVATGEHPRVAGAHLVINQGVTVLGIHPELGQNTRQFLLPDRLDHLVALEHEVAAGDLADATAPVSVRFGHFGADAFQSGHLAVFTEDGDRLAQETELDAFVLHEGVLEVVGGHLAVGAAVDDGYPFGTEPFGDRGGIDGGVAGADDRDVPAERDVVQPLQPFHLRQLAGSDEREGFGDALQVLTGDAHLGYFAHADAEEHRVELVEDLLRRDVHPYFNAGLDLHSEAADELDFLEAYPDRFAHDHDAVGGQATGQLVLLEHGHVVAFFGQLAGAAETGRPGTDDRDAAAGRGCGLERLDAALVQVISGVTLQAADLDGLVVFTHDAGAFAQLLDRAYPGAGGSEQVRLEDGDCRAGHVVSRDLADEQRDVDVGRPGLNAGSVEAVQAAVRLELRFPVRHRRFYFAEAFLERVKVWLRPVGRAMF